MNKLSRSAKVFQLFNILFLGLLALSMLLPILHVLAKSLSGVQALTNSEVGLLPVDFTLLNYQYVLSNPAILRAFAVTIYITVVGTIINLVICMARMVARVSAWTGKASGRRLVSEDIDSTITTLSVKSGGITIHDVSRFERL